MKAYEEGAKIEFYENGFPDEWSYIKEPSWQWDNFDYRVAKTTHTINIDGKEIEISEESYNNLKDSLKED